MFAPIPNQSPALAPLPAPAAADGAPFPSVEQGPAMQVIHGDVDGVPILPYDVAAANPGPEQQLRTLEALRDAFQPSPSQSIIQLFGAEAFNPQLASSQDWGTIHNILSNYRISLEEMNRLREGIDPIGEIFLDNPDIFQSYVDSWPSMSVNERAAALYQLNDLLFAVPNEKLLIRTDPLENPEFFESTVGSYFPDQDIVYLDGLSPLMDNMVTALRLLIHEGRHYIDHREADKFTDLNHIIGAFSNGEINFDMAIAYMQIKTTGFFNDPNLVSYFLDPLEQRAFLEESFAGDSFFDAGFDSPLSPSDVAYANFRNTLFASGVADNPPPPEGLTEQAVA
jgi:hypothetical protein